MFDASQETAMKLEKLLEYLTANSVEISLFIKALTRRGIVVKIAYDADDVTVVLVDKTPASTAPVNTDFLAFEEND